MKNILYTFVLLFALGTTADAQFRIQNNEFIQIGYEDYRTLSFGEETNLPNNGKYSLEYWQQAGGLNFWKPWPTPNFGNYVLFLRDDKNIGIGTAGSSNYRLDVNGALRCQSISFGSDRRLKKNIQPLSNSLQKLMQLEAVSYDYDYTTDRYNGLNANDYPEAKAESMKADQKLELKDRDRMGFIAQEVQKVLPQVVTEDENGLLALNYIDLIPVLTQAIKEQQEAIEKLKAEVAALKSQSATLPNGTQSESVIQGKGSYLFSNAPNPFRNHTVIEYSIADNDALKGASILIHDANGKEIHSQQLEAAAGPGRLEIDASQLASGLYTYTLMINGQVADTKTMLKAAP